MSNFAGGLPSILNSNTVGRANITVNNCAINGDLDMVGDMKLADGSAAAPSLTFASDQDLGFFRVGANEMGYASSGVQKMRLQSGQAVVNNGYSLNFEDFGGASVSNKRILSGVASDLLLFIQNSNPSGEIRLCSDIIKIQPEVSDVSKGFRVLNFAGTEILTVDSSANVTTSNNDLTLTDGKFLRFDAGGSASNGRQAGTDTLVAGVLVVTDLSIAIGDRIICSHSSIGSHLTGVLKVSINAGVAFTITSVDPTSATGATQTADVSTVNWWIAKNN